MIEIEEFQGHPTIVTPDIRLHFLLSGGQWRHRLELIRPGIGDWAVVAAEGLVASAEPDQVVNPTFQELHFQRRGGVVEALLVGQAGPYYFSGVFAVSEDESGTTVDFDLCGRCQGASGGLATTYQVYMPKGATITPNAQRIVWSLGEPPYALEFFAGDQPQHPTRLTALKGDEFCRVEALAANGGQPTQQWHYQWRCGGR